MGISKDTARIICAAQVALEGSGHVIYTRRAHLAGMQVVNVGTSPVSLNWKRSFPQLPLLFGGDICEMQPSIGCDDGCSPGVLHRPVRRLLPVLTQ